MASKEVVKLKAMYGNKFEIKGNRLINVDAEQDGYGYSRYVTKSGLRKFFTATDQSWPKNEIATTHSKHYGLGSVGRVYNHPIYLLCGKLSIGCMTFNRKTTATIKEFALSSTKSNKVMTPSRKRKVA